MHINPEKIIPITELQAKASRLLAELRRSREPVLVTQRGRSAAVLLDVASYNELLRTIERLEQLELEKMIEEGEQAIASGDVVSHAEVKRRLSYTSPRKERKRARG